MKPVLGLNEQQNLMACPQSPNCVCSEIHSQNDATHFIQPINDQGDRWQHLESLIEQHGGVIIEHEPAYIYAKFTSSLFHFVDDVEFHLDQSQGLIHVRSSSRVGHSDFGVNRKRIELIRKEL
ncbi:MAG: DUF1499 domain-containing protein [Mariprofundaceae bacterium]